MKVNIIALMICIQLIFILKVHPTEAFQGFAGKEGKSSCQTLCHQAEPGPIPVDQLQVVPSTIEEDEQTS